ncbi:hypothetical protein [Pseudomonas sp. 31-12]
MSLRLAAQNLHRQLKEWKTAFGADVVESWRTQ